MIFQVSLSLLPLLPVFLCCFYGEYIGQGKKSLCSGGAFFFIIADEVKQKIKNLRTYFGREISKEKIHNKSGSGTSDVYHSKWPHFKSLQFLRDSIQPRTTSSNLVVSL